ncbi:MAG: pilin [Candidatus Peregrinibacteria bacterium]|nr:pilin [Candidatus Peregrinibacteria bacterium]
MIKKVLTSLILSIILAATVQAAIGIPSELQPQNVPLKGLNETITQQVAAGGQDGAVTAANTVLQYVANLLLFFAAPLAVLFIARAGADYAFALGEDSKIESAKRELTWSLIGLVLVMFSYVLVRVIIQPLPLLQQATNAAKVPNPPASTLDSATQKALDKPFGSDVGKDGVTPLSLTAPDPIKNNTGMTLDPSGDIKSSLSTPSSINPSLTAPIVDPTTGLDIQTGLPPLTIPKAPAL